MDERYLIDRDFEIELITVLHISTP
ncbi:MAG: hypothetical protein UW99_C0040G0001, partial [Candidatus Collierbacteria bacterium GW2011_GWC2_45_15]